MSSAPSSPSSPNAFLFGPIIVLLAATGFSAKAILIKLAYVYQVSAVTLLALRMLFSLPFFLGMAWWSNRSGEGNALTYREWGLVCTMGLAGYYLASLLDFLGLQYISAGLERLILFLYPTFVVLLSVVIFHRSITRRDLFALLLSYAGIGVVFWHDLNIGGDTQNVALGSLLVLASLIAYAFYLV